MSWRQDPYSFVHALGPRPGIRLTASAGMVAMLASYWLLSISAGFSAGTRLVSGVALVGATMTLAALVWLWCSARMSRDRRVPVFWCWTMLHVSFLIAAAIGTIPLGDDGLLAVWGFYLLRAPLLPLFWLAGVGGFAWWSHLPELSEPDPHRWDFLAPPEQRVPSEMTELPPRPPSATERPDEGV